MNPDLSRLRSLLGATTTLWAGQDGLEFQEHGWSAISHARSVDYNVVLCHGASAGADLERGVQTIMDAGVPGLMMVTGPALGEVQTLVALGWVCVGSVPLMMIELSPGPGRPAARAAVRRLEPDELDAARSIIDDVFGVGPELSLVAIPRDAAQRAGQAVWGAFDGGDRLASCLASVRAGDTVAIWSMATTPAARGRGYGAAVLGTALAAHADQGARAALLYSSAAGEPFYRQFGFRELERWQQWSRPRWVLGRA